MKSCSFFFGLRISTDLLYFKKFCNHENGVDCKYITNTLIFQMIIKIVLLIVFIIRNQITWSIKNQDYLFIYFKRASSRSARNIQIIRVLDECYTIVT